ncbi:MAG: ester cyclase [Thermomicrobiales bacterium]
MTSEQNRALHERYIDEMNRENFDFLDEYLAPNYVMHGAGVEIEGPEAFKHYVKTMTGAFSNLERRAEDTFATGDRIVTRWSGSAKHTGEFAGIPPTNREVKITGIIISRVEGGRVVEEWEEIDRLGLLQQIGAVPG